MYLNNTILINKLDKIYRYIADIINLIETFIDYGRYFSIRTKKTIIKNGIHIKYEVNQQNSNSHEFLVVCIKETTWEIK